MAVLNATPSMRNVSNAPMMECAQDAMPAISSMEIVAPIAKKIASPATKPLHVQLVGKILFSRIRNASPAAARSNTAKHALQKLHAKFAPKEF
jgi:hypothetical protein